METLTGKWKYKESYAHGEISGELLLKQEGEQLSWKIVLTDQTTEGDSFMIQEVLSGTVNESKMKLEALEVDVIHSEHALDYNLDKWFGIRVDEHTIVGVNIDVQNIEGYFIMEREHDSSPPEE